MITIRVEQIKFLSNGADGGHLYVRGKGTYGDQESIDIYVHFESREQELEFEQVFDGGQYEFVASRWDFMKEIGLSLWNADHWRSITDRP